MGLEKCYIKFQIISSNRTLLLSQLLVYHWSTFNKKKKNYACHSHGPSMNESSVYEMWYNSISEVERCKQACWAM